MQTKENTKKLMLSIIYYCIASKSYKKNNKKTFIEAISLLDLSTVLKILDKLHISSLVYHELKKFNKHEVDNKYLLPVLFYHNLWNKLFTQEMRKIKTKLNKTFYPTILKGASYWGYVYKNTYLRRVEDLDLLVSSNKKIIILSKKLTEMGYVNENPLYLNELFNINKYELSSFSKEISLKVSGSNQKLLKAFIREYNPRFVKQIERCIYEFHSRIEIHKYPFKLRKSIDFPVSRESFFKSNNKGFKMLKDEASLPYLSLKFVSDSFEYIEGNYIKAKCLKLLVDFISIIQTADNRLIAKSIMIAKEWNLLDQYFLVLNSVRILTPEIEYKNLMESNENIINNFLFSFLEKEMGG